MDNGNDRHPRAKGGPSGGNELRSETASRKEPSDRDRLIAERLHSARIMAGWSQERLAEAIGVTFQQVQKYEKGANRISAGRLKQIAEALDVGIAFFFDEPERRRDDLPLSRAEIDLAFALRQSPPEIRARLVALARAIAKLDTDGAEDAIGAPG